MCANLVECVIFLTLTEQLLRDLSQRMQICNLEIHSDKTKIVYCRRNRHSGRHKYEDFTFLGTHSADGMYRTNKASSSTVSRQQSASPQDRNYGTKYAPGVAK